MTLGNQGSSELQKGRNRNRDLPSPNRDEDPCLGSEDPPQLREELPRTYAALFIIQNITNHHPTVDPYWSWEGPPQVHSQRIFLDTSCKILYSFNKIKPKHSQTTNRSNSHHFSINRNPPGAFSEAGDQENLFFLTILKKACIKSATAYAAFIMPRKWLGVLWMG